MAKDVVVEIERATRKKPFLGGFRHKVSAKEFHNASAQTTKQPRTTSGVERFCRDTQTVQQLHQVQQTFNDTSTQMTGLLVCPLICLLACLFPEQQWVFFLVPSSVHCHITGTTTQRQTDCVLLSAHSGPMESSFYLFFFKWWIWYISFDKYFILNILFKICTQGNGDKTRCTNEQTDVWNMPNEQKYFLIACLLSFAGVGVYVSNAEDKLLEPGKYTLADDHLHMILQNVCSGAIILAFLLYCNSKN